MQMYSGDFFCELELLASYYKALHVLLTADVRTTGMIAKGTSNSAIAACLLSN